MLINKLQTRDDISLCSDFNSAHMSSSQADPIFYKRLTVFNLHFGKAISEASIKNISDYTIEFAKLLGFIINKTSMQ